MTIISGLAYGIDKAAHDYALANGLPTVAVVAHGLNTIYPSYHSNLALKMEENGGILTEYSSRVYPDKENFPSRNRIIAGMSDALVLPETGVRGGGMITANIANSIGREVFAFPGRVGDHYSSGANNLIKTQRANLIESYEDLLRIMGWERENGVSKEKVAVELDEDEKILLNYIRDNKGIHIDTLSCFFSGNPATLSLKLLSLEMKRLIKVTPGKYYLPNL